MTAQPCMVHHSHQARCSMCRWAGSVYADPADAATEASEHRRRPEHQGRLVQARLERRQAGG